MPDDFNVNILLPGAVWLLISVLAGRVAVARLETDAITVVMFVVISLVIFIVPMAVCMEYRKKIEQLSERKSKKGFFTVRQRFLWQVSIDHRTRDSMSVFLSSGFPGCPERRQNYDIYGSLASRRLS